MTFGDIVKMVEKNPKLANKEIYLTEFENWHFSKDKHKRVYDVFEILDKKPFTGEDFELDDDDVVFEIG